MRKALYFSSIKRRIKNSVNANIQIVTNMKNKVKQMGATQKTSDNVVTITTKSYIINIPNDVNQNVSFLRLMY